MPGEYDDKFSNLRAFYGYMMGHPGKKLLFMGQEFAQFIEWRYDEQLEWFMLDYPQHKNMQNYVKDLNRFYLKNSPLWNIDCSWEGFRWISSDDNAQSIISFIRTDKSGKELICVCNFVPVSRKNYRIGVPKPGVYKPVFSSDDAKYGGKTADFCSVQSEKIPMHGFDDSISLDVPAMSVTFYKCSKKSK